MLIVLSALQISVLGGGQVDGNVLSGPVAASPDHCQSHSFALPLFQCTKLGRCLGNSFLNHFTGCLDTNKKQLCLHGEMMRISGEGGRPYSILFRGCSFLIEYEAGVLSALRELSPDILKSATRIYGSSSGSIIGTAALCNCDIDEVREAFLGSLKTSFLGFVPGGRIPKIVRYVLEKFLPPNAHEMVSGKLHIVLTRVRDWQNVTVSEFASKEDLIQRYMDGELGMWNAAFVSRSTITVSAFAGEYDICPKEGPAAFLTFQLSDCILQISKRNFCRLQHIFQFPTRQVLNQFFASGYQDTISFLKRLTEFSVDYFEGFTLSFTNGSQQKGGETLHLKPGLRVLCSRATEPEDDTEENPGTISGEEEEEDPHGLYQKGPGQPQKSIFGPSSHFKERMTNLQPSLKAKPDLH